jgi:hypothetical protein
MSMAAGDRPRRWCDFCGSGGVGWSRQLVWTATIAGGGELRAFNARLDAVGWARFSI